MGGSRAERGGQARGGVVRRPPPPAGLRAGAVTSRRLEVPGAEAREGVRGGGPRRRFISGAPPGAQSRSPRPGAPRPAWPRPGPQLALASPGATGRRGTERQAAGGRGA